MPIKQKKRKSRKERNYAIIKENGKEVKIPIANINRYFHKIDGVLHARDETFDFKPTSKRLNEEGIVFLPDKIKFRKNEDGKSWTIWTREEKGRFSTENDYKRTKEQLEDNRKRVEKAKKAGKFVRYSSMKIQ